MPFELAECQRVIGYHFANPNLLEVALTHSSLRTPDRECNERLEFLGDSVLGLVITEELYRFLPDQAEGELTRLKSAVVSRGSLYRASQRLGLARFAEFARGVGRREELPVSVTANLVESVIGAIYLDAGFFPAREFVLRHLGEELDATLSDRGAKNYKSLLQHDVQDAMRLTPTYRTLEEGGPDHKKQFVVAAIIRGQEWGRGEASTKKEAEQEAARMALEAWQRRGRGRRRRRGERGDDDLQGARDVGVHVDDEGTSSEREAAGLSDVSHDGGARELEAEVDLPVPELDEPEGFEPLAPQAPAARPAVPRDAPPPARRAEAPSAPVPRDPPRAAPAPRVRTAAVRPPAPAAPRSDGFAAGLDPAPEAPRPAAAPVPQPTAAAAPRADVGSVSARKKAPAAWTPPPPDEGFGTGL